MAAPAISQSIQRNPATAAVAACLAALSCFFWATGTLLPEEVPGRSSRQITGMALMLTFLPSYFVAALFVTQRRSLALIDELRPQLPDRRSADDAKTAIRGALRRTWPVGCLTGLVLASFNTQPFELFTQSDSVPIDLSLSFGQLVLWLLVGLLLGVRVVVARSFRDLGEIVEIDLFRLDRLRPLARAGLVDVVTIVGALALTPLQSLDAEFRWYNYSFGLMVAVPTALFLLLWPLRSVHRRIREEKQRRAEALDELIEVSPAGETREEVVLSETLLAHRDRLRDLRTWPLGTALLSRFFLYLIIPPLAWVGAALVEMLVDGLIDG